MDAARAAWRVQALGANRLAGVVGQAAPVQFRLERASYLDASLGVDFAATSSRRMCCLDRGHALGSCPRRNLQDQNRPDLAEFRTIGTRHRHGISDAASHPFCPWTNFDRADAKSAGNGGKRPPSCGRLRWERTRRRSSTSARTRHR